jgi:hypothetical protein
MDTIDRDDQSEEGAVDPAFAVGMFCGQWAAGVTRMVSKYAAEGTLDQLVQDYMAGRVRVRLDGTGVIEVEQATSEPPPSSPN